MHILNTMGLPIGEIVVVEQGDDIARIRKAGLPYVVRPARMSDEKILKALLYTIIAKRFPWLKVNGKNDKVVLEAPKIVHGEEAEAHREGGSEGASYAQHEKAGDEGDEVYSRDAYRYSDGGESVDGPAEYLDSIPYEQVDLSDLEAGGLLTVDTAELMDAGLLPKFLQDIGDSIRANLSSYTWVDKWNRKLGAYLGEYEMTDERPNLIVLDVSGSIPAGVSHTMVGLISTLREQANADLIVNSGSSQWWPHDQPIDLDKIERIVGGCNEARQFMRILHEHVLGRKWGNVIGFGDWDAPHRGHKWTVVDDVDKDLEALYKSTDIGHVISYHTTSDVETAGYINWTQQCNVEEGTEHKSKSWVKAMRRYPTW